MGQTRVTRSGEDPRAAELRAAVSRLRRELAGHPAEFGDRAIAEDELAVLAAMVAAGDPEVRRMRRSLLLIAGAVGSVSALSPALMQVRAAVDLFAELPRPAGPAPCGPGAGPGPAAPGDFPGTWRHDDPSGP